MDFQNLCVPTDTNKSQESFTKKGTQLGFRSGMENRKALFHIKLQVPNCRDVQVFLCFIDFESPISEVIRSVKNDRRR